MDTAEDSEKDNLSSVGDSEKEQVGEIVKAFSTMAVCNVS